MAPSEQAILDDTFPENQRGMAFAFYGVAVVSRRRSDRPWAVTSRIISWRWIFFINIPVGIASLMLTQRMVEDPPYLKRQMAQARGARIDFPGLGLIALGLGALQIVLDRGQEDDWFRSHFILILALAAAVSLVVFVIRELRQRNPVVDIRLLGKANFAMANVMIFVLGLVLFGSTVLIPNFCRN